MIVVIDYGMGNLCSIEKALLKIGADFKVSNHPEDIKNATRLILPGVGFFEEGVNNLKKLGLIQVLSSQVIEKRKPLLGICLGMQLLFDGSDEGGAVDGLGFIKGHVKKFEFKDHNLKVPHVGWNNISYDPSSELAILKGIKQDTDFYFVHSFNALEDDRVSVAKAEYGYEFTCAVEKGNIFGTQFHPEKSQKNGLKVLMNFVKFNGENDVED